jgi:hypothetical protein
MTTKRLNELVHRNLTAGEEALKKKRQLQKEAILQELMELELELEELDETE